MAGIAFSNIKQDSILLGLIFVNTYLLVHFLWYVVDAFTEWRVRLTGTRVAFITGGMWGNEELDYPSDPRQSTLYNWWLGRAKMAADIHDKIKEVDDSLDVLKSAISTSTLESEGNHKNATLVKEFAELKSSLRAMASSLNVIQGALEADRLKVSLARFDSWFKFFLKSQNLRWFLVEVSIPVAVGIWAVIALAIYIFSPN